MVSKTFVEMTNRKKERCRKTRDTLLGGKGTGNIPATELWCFPLPFGLLSKNTRMYLHQQDFDQNFVLAGTGYH